MRVSRARDSVALPMFDIDEFKRVNDICTHAVGDQILVALAEPHELARPYERRRLPHRRRGVRRDHAVLQRGDALGLARRLTERLETRPVDAAGDITVSVGIAQGPENACTRVTSSTARSRR